mgnify:CR=1 FL=1
MPFHWEHLADPAALSQDAPVQPAKKSGMGPWPYVASAAGDGLDLWSTAASLSRGGREANPLLGSSLKTIVPLKAAGSVGFLLALRQVAKHHPTLAKWLGYGNGIGKGAIALHNHRVAR